MEDSCGADIRPLTEEQHVTLVSRFPFLSAPTPAFPLHEAARCNDFVTLESLLTATPPFDINACDTAGNTALHVAAAAFACEVQVCIWCVVINLSCFASFFLVYVGSFSFAFLFVAY
jgi:hypothetical protein